MAATRRMMDVTARTASDAGPPDEPRLGQDQLLLIWFSPSFPVGAFAYSHGLEMAVEQSLVRDRTSLTAWMRDLAELGSLRNDLILAAAAWRAASAADWKALAETAELGAALQPSAERYLEATQQGTSFLQQIDASWPSTGVAEALAALREQGMGRDDSPITYPVAIALAAAGHSVGCDRLLAAYTVAFCSNLVSAGIRLSVIGQTDGQRILAELGPDLMRLSQNAVSTTIADLGTASFRSDLVSLQHETQHTRLFRS